MTIGERRLALVAGETWRARAGVQALAGVEAGAAVHARLMVRAIVEVLVAEQSAPALVALAIPGLLAATVKTSGISDALIALRALPAVVTSATERDETWLLSINARMCILKMFSIYF